jgi:hypothetical protein
LLSQSIAYIKIRTTPIAKFFGYYVKFPWYVHGHHFRISIYIRNMDVKRFVGGLIQVVVSYGFVELPEIIRVPVPPIDIGNEVRIPLKGKLGVLAHGHALFFAKLYDNRPLCYGQENLALLCDNNSQVLTMQPNGYHIHSFYALSKGELYTLTALFATILSSIILNYDKILGLFRSLLEAFG